MGSWENWVVIIFGIIVFIINFFIEPSRFLTGLWILIAIVFAISDLDASLERGEKK